MRRPVWPYLLLAAFCAGLFFWRLGAVPLIGYDEGLYAESSREMLATGNYVVPFCNGGPFYEKPPATYWLEAASMRALGVSSFAARFPCAVEELLLVGLTVFLGTRLFGRRAGLMAGSILASSLLTVGLARMAITDAAFTLLIAASLGAFMLCYMKLMARGGYLVFWAAMGLSALVKGPAGPVLILAVVLIFLLVRRDLGAILKTLPLAGLPIAFAIALPWYILVQQQTSGAFVREFIFHQNLQRALGADFQHNAPLWFYIPAYLVGFFPWSIFLPAALLQSRKLVSQSRKHECAEAQKRTGADRVAFRDLSGAERNGNPETPDLGGTPEAISPNIHVFLTVWIAVVFLVFTIFPSKLPAYIFPIYPASALLVAALWLRASDRKEAHEAPLVLSSPCEGDTEASTPLVLSSPCDGDTEASTPLVLSSPRSGHIEGRWLTRSALITAIFAAIIGAAVLIIPPYLRDPIPGLPAALIPMAIALVAGSVACYILLILKRPLASFTALCLAMGAVALVAVRFGLPIAARPNAQPAAKVARLISTRPEPALAYNLSPPQPALGFYSARPVPDVDSVSRLRGMLRLTPNSLIVAQSGRLQGLPSQTTIIARIGPYILLQVAPADPRRG